MLIAKHTTPGYNGFMAKPRSKEAIFPYLFQKNGRSGTVTFWPKTEKYGTRFWFAGRPRRNSFRTFDAAIRFLDQEFSVLDADLASSRSLNPINGDLQTYRDLELMLRQHADGATLREAVDYFISHFRSEKSFTPKKVEECCDLFLKSEKHREVSDSHLETLEKHFKAFKEKFAQKEIHTINAGDILEWMVNRIGEDGNPWGPTTRKHVRGSLVSLFIHARDILKAIPECAKTEPQKIKNPKDEDNAEVEIYSPEEFSKLLLTAMEHDIEVLVGIVIQGFEGLRPNEFHAEEARGRRGPLTWGALNWDDHLLHVIGQKVRSKATRDVPLHTACRAWLEPFKSLSGPMWNYSSAWDNRLKKLCDKAGIGRLYDVLRHSYASYRIRILSGNLAKLADEMGNSPEEIINSYKRNVKDSEAEAWFGIMPPPGYADKMKCALEMREKA